jgi:hypothetical protein
MEDNFFFINMPYGMERDDKGQWFVFNRLRLPLGWNAEHPDMDPVHGYYGVPVYAAYEGLTDEKIDAIAVNVSRCAATGKILMFLLYDPVNSPLRYDSGPEVWAAYFERLKKIARFKK